MSESLLAELTRLRNEQSKARQDEVYGGLSTRERGDYKGRIKRIQELESGSRISTVANLAAVEKRIRTAPQKSTREKNRTRKESQRTKSEWAMGGGSRSVFGLLLL
jgi:hypothetical protein